MDASAGRDARRRKILENSSSRLMKITGRSCLENTVGVEDSSKPTHSTPVSLKRNAEKTVNGIVTDNYKQLNDSEIFTSEETWSELFSPHSSSYRHTDLPKRAESIGGTVGKSLSSDDITSPFHDDVRPDYGSDRNAVDRRLTTPVKTTFPWSLITSRMIYVLLALVVNLLLAWKLDYLFGKTIVIPWFTVLLIHLYGHRSTVDSQAGSLLFVALILCNIKPELTYRLKIIVTVVSIIIGDLALYIFSFTLIYFGISLCSRDVDILNTADL